MEKHYSWMILLGVIAFFAFLAFATHSCNERVKECFRQGRQDCRI